MTILCPGETGKNALHSVYWLHRHSLRGAIPGLVTRDRQRSNAAGPGYSSGSGCRIRTDISALVRAGVLPLDEP
jgi:hypothetical protein